MHKPLSLRENFSWTFVGNVVSAVCQWGILTTFVKLGNPEMVGKFALGLAIAIPVTTFSMMQLRAVQVTDARHEYAFRDYFGTRLLLGFLGILIISGIAYFGGYSKDTAWVIFLVGLIKSITSLCDIVHGLFQRYERMNLSAGSLMIRGVCSLVAVFIAMRLFGEIIPALVAMAIVYLIIFFAYDISLGYKLLSFKAGPGRVNSMAPSFDTRTTLRLVWLALPLGLVMFFGTLQNSIPKYILEAFHGEASLGYFAAIAYPMAIGTLVINAMGQSASPRLANYCANNFTSYIHLVRKLLLIGLGMGILFIGGVALFGKLALTILYSADYAEHQAVFTLLACGTAIAFMVSFYGYSFTAARLFKTQLIMRIITCSLTVLAAFCLIPSYGLYGAAITTIITFLVALACRHITMSVYISKRRKQMNQN